ncbi:hypothetical protein [Sphingobacterium ginsenosidimutans]|uniref:Major facilitator superfamily (MFS) profile domain-containing protein n=1 Tax=Sphingobacterium ginsenosidimutans TaxID=687845 RepID=A0ABP8A2P2_9SPHI
MANLFNFKPGLTATKPEKKIHSTAIVFIFITLTIDVIGFGLIIPVMPKLIATLKNISIRQASLWGGYLLTVYAIMQIAFSLLIRNLSDKYGMRPIILIALLGFFADYMFPRLGNEKNVYLGLLLYALGMILLAIATQSWMLYAFLIPYVLGNIAYPTLQSLISDRYHPTNRVRYNVD